MICDNNHWVWGSPQEWFFRDSTEHGGRSSKYNLINVANHFKLRKPVIAVSVNVCSLLDNGLLEFLSMGASGGAFAFVFPVSFAVYGMSSSFKPKSSSMLSAIPASEAALFFAVKIKVNCLVRDRCWKECSARELTTSGITACAKKQVDVRAS